ncbi:hypothetical protein BB559_004229 [Furculomyces boomerangus]|uniref:Uncharacterized protein n=2 Tax=Harpellales TaxID=61421 RepID=A0A2T9YG12_9FUNG|nr:hypothetical protein BB559_004229 [Furculomyces boomerangus]PWA01936.1 hypothetical protein BB558_001951 [Smittium angustum]
MTEKEAGKSSHPKAKEVELAKQGVQRSAGMILTKLVKFFSSRGGCDNALMLIQYSAKIAVWLFLRTKRDSVANRLIALSALISDYRIMARVTDFFPLYISSIHTLTNPPKSNFSRLVNSLQSISMMLFYPFERLYWLGGHGIIPMEKETIGKVALLSVRFWAFWVVLNFLRLGQSYHELMGRKQHCLTQSKSDAGAMQKELEEIDGQVTVWKRSLVNNLAYLPLTLHWSIPNNVFPDVAVGIFGTIAGISSAMNRW